MSATMWKQYTDEYILEPQKKSPASISEVIQNGDVKLLELMEYLGSSLTNTDLSIRGRATKLIADVLHLIPTNHLSSQEVAVLCRFLSEKLSDHHSIQPPALHGIVALATYLHLPDGSAELICRQIFKEVQNQSLSQADRRNVYTIINTLLDSKLEEIKSMGSDFVHGYIQTMDAEKDPRNLIIAFQIAKKVIINFSLGVFVEEMFEVVSCYFPVSFSPPPDNPHGITKEDLVLSLRACLAATPLFGEFCLPLLLEKLTSDIQSAKIDALETLTDCSSVYGTSALKEYTSSFYSCIRKEVMEGDSHEVKAAALKCLSAIITSLSCDTAIDCPSVLKSYIEEILAEYKIYLLKSDVKILYSSSCLVHCICSVNSIACCMVLNTVVLSILLQYNNQTQIMCRGALIAILSQFIIHASNHEDKLVTSILNSHKSELIKTYTQLLAARDKDTCVLGIQGLAAIFRCKNMLTEVEADELGNHLLKRVLSSDDEKIRHETVSSLKILSSKFTSVVKTSILPKLIQEIRHEKMVVEGDYHPSADEILQIMADISNQYDLIKDVSLLIIGNLRNFKDSACTKETLTSCLCTMITNNQKSSDIIKLFVDDILPNTTNILSLCMFDKEEIGNLAKVYRIITTQVDNRKAVALAEEMVSLLLLVHSQQTAKNAGNKEENTLIPIITAVICSLPKSETVPRKTEVVNVLLQLAMEIDNSEISENCIKCLAGLVNKLPEPDVSDTMNKIEEFLKPLLTSSQSTNNSSSVLLLAWITKALVLRNHPTGKNYFEKCIELLSSSVGDQVSHGFGIILTEYEDILNKVMKADIKMFYQQRLFVEHCGKIVEGYTESESTEVKKNFLVALSHLIKPLPKHVFLSELPPLLPLLIHSLDYEDKNLLVLTLATIQTLLDDESGSAIVCQHLDTIIPQLLKLSQYQKDMKIRIAALICLAGISRQPVHFILPYRTSIVRCLLPALDDRKRLVRKEAVNARTSWFLIAEPGS